MRNTLDFEGKIFVGTEVDPEWFKQEVESRGGIFKPKFVVSLDYLVYGPLAIDRPMPPCLNPNIDPSEYVGTVKLRKAKELVKKGKDVKILSLEEFKKML